MKKTFCILISIVLLISLFPAFAFAEEADPVDEAAPLAVDFTVTTKEPTGITYRSVVIGGTISNPNGLNVKECGVRYWDGGPNPGPLDFQHKSKFTTVQNGDFSKKFVSWAGDLSPEHMYSYYAYVIYETPDSGLEVTVNGETKSFTTEPNPHGTRTLTDPATGIVLTGDYIHKDTTFSTVQIDPGVKAIYEKELQAGYHLEFTEGLDLYLAPTTEGFPVKGSVLIEIPVGEKYNGQTMRMFAMFASDLDSEPAIFSGTVLGGYLSVEMEPCFLNIAVEVPDAVPTPEPGFEERKIYTRPVGMDGVLIEVVGRLAPGAELKAEMIQPDTDAYKKLSEKVENGKTILMNLDIDVVTPEGTAPFTGAVKLSFAVGKKYDGQTLRVLHLVDGVVIEHTGIVEDGVLTVLVDRFSPFAVEVPKDAVNQNPSGTETKKSPKTDDPAMLWLYLAMAGGATAALAGGAYKKKKA